MTDQPAATLANGAPHAVPHTHTPGAALHDDHLCDKVRCQICGKAGRNVSNTWRDLDPITQT